MTSLFCVALVFVLTSCAKFDSPGARHADVPSPVMADKRAEAINEKPDSVLYLPLGSDVLVPEVAGGEPLPSVYVGPFELRSETVAGALQLVLADYEVPMAFETNEGLTRTVTVTNLRGPLNSVVDKICGLADLYCAFEDGVLTIKDTQIFTVSIPPIGGADSDFLDDLATGLEAITGNAPVTEQSTRTIVYEATSRTAKMAERYFQRVRSNTALIMFEVYIWEVDLNSDHAAGVNWTEIEAFGKFTSGFSVAGAPSAANAISIGLPTSDQINLTTDDVFRFISNYGAVKTISQPQVTMLSGSSSTLRVADTINYVSSLERSTDNGEVTVSTETDSVDTGFTMTIASAWDNATIYGTIDIALQEFRQFEIFGEGTDTELSLPQTTERELQTQVRIRPGDSLLIAGLVREKDTVNKSGPGLAEPILATSQDSDVENRELVFLLKPRVVVYTAEEVNSGMSSSHAPKAMQGGFPVGTIPLNLLDPSGF